MQLQPHGNADFLVFPQSRPIIHRFFVHVLAAAMVLYWVRNHGLCVVMPRSHVACTWCAAFSQSMAHQSASRPHDPCWALTDLLLRRFVNLCWHICLAPSRGAGPSLVCSCSALSKENKCIMFINVHICFCDAHRIVARRFCL